MLLLSKDKVAEAAHNLLSKSCISAKSKVCKLGKTSRNVQTNNINVNIEFHTKIKKNLAIRFVGKDVLARAVRL